MSLSPQKIFTSLHSQERDDTALSHKNNIWQPNRVNPNKMFFPLSIGCSLSGMFTLPYEPRISISTKNNIIIRDVAHSSPKTSGSVKERWSRDDYNIKIEGVLIGYKEIGDLEVYPSDPLTTLVKILEAPQSLFVLCEPLQLLGIQRIVIKDYNLPFTKGENMQQYEINAISDTNSDTQLLIKL